MERVAKCAGALRVLGAVVAAVLLTAGVGAPAYAAANLVTNEVSRPVTLPGGRRSAIPASAVCSARARVRFQMEIAPGSSGRSDRTEGFNRRWPRPRALPTTSASTLGPTREVIRLIFP